MGILKKLACKSMREDLHYRDFHTSERNDAHSESVAESTRVRNLPVHLDLHGCDTAGHLELSFRAVDGRREGNGATSGGSDHWAEFDDLSTELLTGGTLGRERRQGSRPRRYSTNEQLNTIAGRQRGGSTTSSDSDGLNFVVDTSTFVESEGASGNTLQPGASAYELGTYRRVETSQRVRVRQDKENALSADYIIDEVRKSLREKVGRQRGRSAARHEVRALPTGATSPQSGYSSETKNLEQYGHRSHGSKHAPQENPAHGGGYVFSCASLVADLLVGEKAITEEHRGEGKPSRGRVQFTPHVQESHRIPRHHEQGSDNIDCGQPSSSMIDDTASCSQATTYSESVHSRSTCADDVSNFDDSSMGSVEMLVHHVLCTHDNRITARDWVT